MRDESDFSEETTGNYMRLLQELGMGKASESKENHLMNNPFQQSHRIILGLNVAYQDDLDRPDRTRVEEQARFMARWPKAKLLDLAKAGKREDIHGDPEYYESLALALLLAENQGV